MAVSLVHPLPGGTPTGGFRWRPAFTENGVHVPAMLHNGQDWGAPAGTLIRAAHAGTVSGVFYDAAQGGGWMVRIHAHFGYTMYGHMLRQSPYVKVGDKVAAGQTIGEVGATGLATGTHLHFILNLNGRDVDPMPYIGASKPSQTTPATPTTGQEEEDEMAIAVGHYIGGNEKTPAKQRLSVIFYPGSGFYTLFSGVDQDYINAQARAHGTKDFTRITKEHWEQTIKPQLDKLLAK